MHPLQSGNVQQMESTVPVDRQLRQGPRALQRPEVQSPGSVRIDRKRDLPKKPPLKFMFSLKVQRYNSLSRVLKATDGL